jgi:hypothetical protein
MTLTVRSQLGLIERLTGTIDDCGPASVAMAATALGVDTSTKDAWKAARSIGRVDTKQGAEGTSARQVVDTCKALGLKARIEYQWANAAEDVRLGAILILNIQAGAWIPRHLQSAWQVKHHKKHPTDTYGHWVVLAHDGIGWLYACPTMKEGEPGRRVVVSEVKALRDSKGTYGFPTPPAMIVVKRKGE